MSAPSRLRLAVVLSHPIQYYSPWFRWIAANTPIDLHVFYLWEFGIKPSQDRSFGKRIKWDVDLLSGYTAEFLPNKARDPGTHHFFGLRNPGLPKRLKAFQPDALLLFGYKSSSLMRAAVWARLEGVPIIFRGDSHFLGREAASRSWRRMPLRMLYSQIASFIYVGAANRAYFEALGVPSRKLFFAPHAVNRELFNPADARHQTAARELRMRLGLSPSTRVVLFAGKLVPSKQPRALLEAFIALNFPDTALIILGDGQERSALCETARRSPEGSVHLLPFANQTEMPARYLLADLFVLPSTGLYETWGLAVNEAMHMGVPCLVSDRVGCQKDLVTPGETGWVFPAAKPDQLAHRLGEALEALSDPLRAKAIRSAVSERISGYTYSQTTDGLLDALVALKSSGNGGIG